VCLGFETRYARRCAAGARHTRHTAGARPRGAAPGIPGIPLAPARVSLDASGVQASCAWPALAECTVDGRALGRRGGTSLGQRRWQANLALKSATQDGPLDPLIRGLIDFVEQGELVERIRKVFQRMDVDESGGISMQELNEGLRRLFHGSSQSCPCLSREEFESVTEHGYYCDESGELDMHDFEEMVLAQIRKFCLRKVCSAIAVSDDDGKSDSLFALKMLLNYTHLMHDELLARLPANKAAQRKKVRERVIARMQQAAVYRTFTAWSTCVATTSPDDPQHTYVDTQDSDSLPADAPPWPRGAYARAAHVDAGPDTCGGEYDGGLGRRVDRLDARVAGVAACLEQTAADVADIKAFLVRSTPAAAAAASSSESGHRGGRERSVPLKGMQLVDTPSRGASSRGLGSAPKSPVFASDTVRVGRGAGGFRLTLPALSPGESVAGTARWGGQGQGGKYHIVGVHPFPGHQLEADARTDDTKSSTVSASPRPRAQTGHGVALRGLSTSPDARTVRAGLDADLDPTSPHLVAQPDIFARKLAATGRARYGTGIKVPVGRGRAAAALAANMYRERIAATLAVDVSSLPLEAAPLSPHPGPRSPPPLADLRHVDAGMTARSEFAGESACSERLEHGSESHAILPYSLQKKFVRDVRE